MALEPLSTAEIEQRLHVWLDTEFTFFKVEVLAAELAVLSREEQDFILDWIRRIASTHITLAWQFGRRAPALLPRMERRLLEAWAIHTCDIFDRTGLQTALRVMEQVDSFDTTAHVHDAAGVLFEDIAPVLGNFLCGLSGRRLKLEQGDAAFTDGERVVLPNLIARFDQLSDNFQLAKATVALLWAQTRFGTLRVDLQAVLAPRADPEHALTQFHALESLRLTARIGRELPGLYREMQRLSHALNETLPTAWHDFAVALAAPDASVETSLALLDAACALPAFPSGCYHGTLRPDAVAAARAGRAEKEKARLRVKLAELLEALPEKTAPRDTSEHEAPPRIEAKVRDENGALDFDITLDDAPLAPPEGVKQLLTSIYLDFGEIPPEYLTPAGEGEYDPNLYSGSARRPRCSVAGRVSRAWRHALSRVGSWPPALSQKLVCDARKTRFAGVRRLLP